MMGGTTEWMVEWLRLLKEGQGEMDCEPPSRARGGGSNVGPGRDGGFVGTGEEVATQS